MYACTHSNCSKSFPTDWQFIRHYRIHTGIYPYRCRLCDYASTFEGNVIKHIRWVHFGLRLTLRQQREAGIVDMRKAKKYVQVDSQQLKTEQRLLRCALKFAQVSASADEPLDREETSDASSDDDSDSEPEFLDSFTQRRRQYVCRFGACGSVNPSISKLYNHTRIHTGFRPYSCAFVCKNGTLCGQEFTHTSSARGHVRVMHWKLPLTQREQREKCIVDDRNPDAFIRFNRELIEKEKQLILQQMAFNLWVVKEEGGASMDEEEEEDEEDEESEEWGEMGEIESETTDMEVEDTLPTGGLAVDQPLMERHEKEKNQQLASNEQSITGENGPSPGEESDGQSLPFGCRQCGFRSSLKSTVLAHIRVHFKKKRQFGIARDSKVEDFLAVSKEQLAKEMDILEDSDAEERSFLCFSFEGEEEIRLDSEEDVNMEASVLLNTEKDGQSSAVEKNGIENVMEPVVTAETQEETATYERYSCPQVMCTSTFASLTSLCLHMRAHWKIYPFACKLCSFVSAEKEHTLRHIHRRHILKRACQRVEGEGAQINNLIKKPSAFLRIDKDQLADEAKKLVELFGEKTLERDGSFSEEESELEENDEAESPIVIDPIVYGEADATDSLGGEARGGKEDPVYRCPEEACKRAFPGEIHLRRHMRTHWKNRPFGCTLCSYTSALKCNAMKHINDHLEKMRPFGGKAASKPENWLTIDKGMLAWEDGKLRDICVDIHAKRRKTVEEEIESPKEAESDEGADNFQIEAPSTVGTGGHTCPYADCDKAFPDRARLEKHFRSHGNVRPFECRICGVHFKEKYHAVRHIRKCHCKDSGTNPLKHLTVHKEQLIKLRGKLQRMSHQRKSNETRSK